MNRITRHHWLLDDDIMGDIKHRDTVQEVEILRRDKAAGRRYSIRVGERFVSADCINVGGAAAALDPGSVMHLGGDRWKRVTLTETAGERYAFIEVGDRD